MIRLFALAAPGLLALSAVARAGCAPDQVELRGPWGQARFGVELADDPNERAQGLMFREELGKSAGMIFVYPRPQQVRFWMKNTLIPLDMIFIDATGTVTRVHSNAIPHDTTGIDGGDGVLAVLEINGGLAAALGIAPGTEVRYPAFQSGDPAWPCEPR